MTSLDVCGWRQPNDHPALSSFSALHHLHSLRQLRSECAGIDTQAHPFTNLQAIALHFTHPTRVCNLKPCTAAVSLKIGPPTCGLTRLLLPSGPHVKLQELELSAHPDSQGDRGINHVENLGQAACLTHLKLCSVYPYNFQSEVRDWPTDMPVLNEVTAFSMPFMAPCPAELAFCASLQFVIWSCKRVLPDSFVGFTQLRQLSVPAAPAWAISKITQLSQLETLTMTYPFDDLEACQSLLQLAIWPNLQCLRFALDDCFFSTMDYYRNWQPSTSLLFWQLHEELLQNSPDCSIWHPCWPFSARFKLQHPQYMPLELCLDPIYGNTSLTWQTKPRIDV